MLVICGLIVAVSAVQAAPTSESAGRVNGRVTIEGTNTAVPGVRIMLFPAGRLMRPADRPRPAGPMGPPPQAVTDQDGRFVFDRIFAGTYTVNADKTGFVPFNQPDQPHTVEVVSGRATALDIQLQKGAVVSGRVIDPSGEPMADLSIMAMRRMAVRSGAPMPRLIPACGGAQTNDIGEFRLPGLAAGEYYIVAMPRGQSPFGGPGVTPPSGNAKTTIAATFYPGTTDQQAAQPIAVAAGAEVGNISFAMQSAAAFRISGVVVDENGDPVDGAMVMLMGDPRGGMFLGPRGGGGQSRVDGRFTIGYVTAGSYRVTASIPIGMNGAGGRGSFVTFGSGGIVSGGAAVGAAGGVVDQPTEVVVTDADVSGVRVVVRRPARQ
jgi:protocatechuate 3,4-dioxygenase beta subunit